MNAPRASIRATGPDRRGVEVFREAETQPGVISSVLIYIPLAIYAYAGYLSAGKLTWPQAGLSVLLGAACMGLLMAYVLRRQVHAGGMRGSK